MNAWLTILGAVLAVFTVAGAGTMMRRLDWLTEEADQSLMALTVRVLMPCLILTSVIGNPSLSSAGNILLPPVLSVGTLLLGFGAAWVWAKLVGARGGLGNGAQVRAFMLAVGVYNYGYIPVPLAKLLFNEGTLGVLFVFYVGMEFSFWTLGVLVLTGNLGKAWWKKLLNPPCLAVVTGVFINLAHLDGYLPKFLMQAVGMLGASAVPVSLLLVGATIADHLHSAQWHKGGAVVGGACLLRLGLLPPAMIALAWLLPCSVELKRVLVLEAAMPAAMFPIVMTKYYEGDTTTVLRVVLGTSLAALATIPLWLSGGLTLLKLQ